jgi:Response regulator containing a CheY-like receiver domain and an HTH DNA-binding domain
MATRDPMDLNVRSQAFLSDFYRFHQNSCDAWYIKDANHRFVDASITFLSRCSPPDLTSVVGLSDDDISEASTRDVALMHEFESLVMSQSKEITILTRNYFMDCNDIRSYILKMKPWYQSDGIGVIVYVSDLAEINKKTDWLSLLLPGLQVTTYDLKSFNDKCINPRVYLTESEWTIAWLVICGFSLRKISGFIDMKRQSVDLKISHAYLKLGVSNREELFEKARRNRWVNFIPDRFIADSNVIRLS